MPGQNNSNQPSPFEISTTSRSKKGGKKGIIIAVSIVVFLILSVVAGVLLVRQNQNIQEKAAYPTCPGGEQCPVNGYPDHLRSCTPAQSDNSPDEMLCSVVGRVGVCGNVQYCCPAVNGAWTTDMTACKAVSPTPTPNLQTDKNNCGSIGNVCVTGMTCVSGVCSSSTATPTATPTTTPTATSSSTSSPTSTPTPTATTAITNPVATINAGTSSPTATPTATSVASVQKTSRPVPVTGTDWPTVVGAGVGVVVIIGSILLAI